LCAAGVVLHHCPATALPGCNLRIQTSSGPEGDVCLWWSSPSRTATRNGVREAAFPGDITFLEGMDREIKVQGSLARDDQPVGLNVEVADQPGAWIVDRSADIFPAGTNWRSAQLGLSLHMVARCDIYALRADPTRFCRRNRGVHRLVEGAAWRRCGKGTITGDVRDWRAAGAWWGA